MTAQKTPNQSSLATLDDFQPAYFQDTGCVLLPSCLNCPLPECIEDRPEMLQQYRQAIRDKELIDRWQHGLKAEEQARNLGVDVRTVYRLKVRWESISSALVAHLNSGTLVSF